jgi:hypothetical protein
MSYIAIKNFSVNEKEFKIGDAIPTMFVQDRLIRAKKIKLASEVAEVKEVPEVPVNQEILNEVVPETTEATQEILLTEDSSIVEVITEEVKTEEVEVQAVKNKPSKKSNTK